MLSLKKQVCSLEYAKKLKELGVKQESLFYWYERNAPGKPKDSLVSLGHTHGPNGWSCDTYSAFTVAELGVMLPSRITRSNREYKLIAYKHALECDLSWTPTYHNSPLNYVFLVKDGMVDGVSLTSYPYYKHPKGVDWMTFSEADNRVFLLISLLEDELITVSEINERI